jgi:transglutaminase/protease-like cytokinesis protein 3
MMLPKLYAMSAMWTLNARKELSSRFSTDFNSSSAKRSRSQIATMQFRRHSVDGSWTVKIESSVEMMDIPEHMFEPRTEPYPGDINRPKSACRIP